MGLCLSEPVMGDALSKNSRWKGTPKGQGGFNTKQEFVRAEQKRDEALAQLGCRHVYNGRSKYASMFTQQGKKGPNQDAMIVWENFLSKDDIVMAGVFDGHGPYGHVVAKRIRNSLPSWLADFFNATSEELRKSLRDPKIKAKSKGGGAEGGGGGSRGNKQQQRDRPPPPHHHHQQQQQRQPAEIDHAKAWKIAHQKAFKAMDAELRAHPVVDAFCSGSTCVTAIRQGRNLIYSNLGDSRIVLGVRCGQMGADPNAVAPVQLTTDLKPNVPEEAERIKLCRGRIFALRDEPDIARVWLPHEDSPGLAMARAFGDMCLKDYGVISQPEVSHRLLTSDDLFVVLATDGIWDVLSNAQVVKIVGTCPERQNAGEHVVKAAVSAWGTRYPDAKVDDCACVVMYLGDEGVCGGERGSDFYSDCLSSARRYEEMIGVRHHPRTAACGSAPPSQQQQHSKRAAGKMPGSIFENRFMASGLSSSGLLDWGGGSREANDAALDGDEFMRLSVQDRRHARSHSSVEFNQMVRSSEFHLRCVSGVDGPAPDLLVMGSFGGPFDEIDLNGGVEREDVARASQLRAAAGKPSSKVHAARKGHFRADTMTRIPFERNGDQLRVTWQQQQQQHQHGRRHVRSHSMADLPDTSDASRGGGESALHLLRF